jgi:hypothetical protein
MLGFISPLSDEVEIAPEVFLSQQDVFSKSSLLFSALVKSGRVCAVSCFPHEGPLYEGPRFTGARVCLCVS